MPLALQPFFSTSSIPFWGAGSVAYMGNPPFLLRCWFRFSASISPGPAYSLHLRTLRVLPYFASEKVILFSSLLTKTVRGISASNLLSCELSVSVNLQLVNSWDRLGPILAGPHL